MSDLENLHKLRTQFHSTAHEMRRDEWAYLEALETALKQSESDLREALLLVGRIKGERDLAIARIPDPDDLRTVVTNVSGPRNPVNNAEWWAAVDRLCATLEGEA